MKTKKGKQTKAEPLPETKKSLNMVQKVVGGIAGTVGLFVVVFFVLWATQSDPKPHQNRHLNLQGLPAKVQRAHTILVNTVGTRHVDKFGNAYLINSFFLRDFHEYTFD